MHRPRSNTTRSSILRQLLNSRKYTRPSLVSKPEQGYEFYNRNRGRFDKHKFYLDNEREIGSSGIRMDTINFSMLESISMGEERGRARWLDWWMQGGCEDEQLGHYWVDEYELTGKCYGNRAWREGKPSIKYRSWDDLRGSGHEEAVIEVDAQDLSPYLTEIINEISYPESKSRAFAGLVHSGLPEKLTWPEPRSHFSSVSHSSNGNSNPRLSSPRLRTIHGAYPDWLLPEIHALLEGNDDTKDSSQESSPPCSHLSFSSSSTPRALPATTPSSSSRGTPSPSGSPKPLNPAVGAFVLGRLYKSEPSSPTSVTLELDAERAKRVRSLSFDYSSIVASRIDNSTFALCDTDFHDQGTPSSISAFNNLDSFTSITCASFCPKGVPCTCTSEAPAKQESVNNSTDEESMPNNLSTTVFNENFQVLGDFAFDHFLLPAPRVGSPSRNRRISYESSRIRHISPTYERKIGIKTARLLSSPNEKVEHAVSEYKENDHSVSGSGDRKHEDKHEDHERGEEPEDEQEYHEQLIATPCYHPPLQTAFILRLAGLGLRSALLPMTMPIYKAIAERVAEREKDPIDTSEV